MRIDTCGASWQMPIDFHFDPLEDLYLNRLGLLLENQGNQRVRVWDLKTGTCMSQVDLTTHRVSWSDQVPFTATQTHACLLVHDPAGVWFYDLFTGAPFFVMESPQTAQFPEKDTRMPPGLCLSGDDRVLAIADKNEEVHIVDLEQLRQIRTSETGLAYSKPVLNADGTLLAACWKDDVKRGVAVWSVETGETKLELEEDYLQGKPMDYVFSGSHLVFLMEEDGSKLHFWNIESGKKSSFKDRDYAYAGLRDSRGWFLRERPSEKLFRLKDEGFDLEEVDEKTALEPLLQPMAQDASKLGRLQRWGAEPQELLELSAFLTNFVSVEKPQPCVWLAPERELVIFGEKQRFYRFAMDTNPRPPLAVNYSCEMSHFRTAGTTTASISGKEVALLEPDDLEIRRVFFRDEVVARAPKCFLLSNSGDRIWFNPNYPEVTVAAFSTAGYGQELYELMGHKYEIEVMAHAELGNRLYARSGNTQLIGWDLSNKSVLFLHEDKNIGIEALACNRNGSKLYSSTKNKIEERDGTSGMSKCYWQTDIADKFAGMVLNESESLLYAWSFNGDVIVLSLHDGSGALPVRTHSRKLVHLWPRGESGFYTAGLDDGFLHCWQPPYQEPVESFLFYPKGGLRFAKGQCSAFGETPTPQRVLEKDLWDTKENALFMEAARHFGTEEAWNEATQWEFVRLLVWLRCARPNLWSDFDHLDKVQKHFAETEPLLHRLLETKLRRIGNLRSKPDSVWASRVPSAKRVAVADAVSEPTKTKEDMREEEDFRCFVKRYEEVLGEHAILSHMNHENAKLSGYFNHETMTFGFNFADKGFEVKAQHFHKEGWEALLQEEGLDPEERRADIAHLYVNQTGGWEALYIMEAMTHEAFHLWQSMTLQACCEFTSAVRSLVTFRDLFICLNLEHKGVWHWPESVFEPAFRLNEKNHNFHFSMGEFLQEDLNTVAFCRSPDNGLSTMDLIEGAAYFAQKSIMNSWEIETIPLKANPMYHRAFKEFEAAGGRGIQMFLLVLIVSLKLGRITQDALSFIDGCPSPVQVFRFLLETVNFEREEARFKKPLQARIIKPWMADWSSSTCHLYWAMLDLFERLCRETKTRFRITRNDFSPGNHGKMNRDLRFRTLFSKMRERHPFLEDDAFSIAMIVDFKLLQKMTVDVQNTGHWEIPLEPDDWLADREGLTLSEHLEIINFLEKFVLLLANGKLPRCCPDHDPEKNKNLRRRHILNCKHPEGMNRSFQNLFGCALKDVILFPQ